MFINKSNYQLMFASNFRPCIAERLLITMGSENGQKEKNKINTKLKLERWTKLNNKAIEYKKKIKYKIYKLFIKFTTIYLSC